MKQILLLPIIFALFLLPCLAQEVNKPIPLNKTFKKGGWNIPTAQDKQLTETTTTSIDNQSVTVQSYKFKTALKWQTDLYFLRADNTLNVFSLPFEINGVSSYTVNGKTFAYRIICTTIGTGADIKTYYFDEDGDGQFETRYLYELPNKIPNWVTASKN